MGIRDFVRSISPPWLVGPGTPGVPLPENAGVSERFLYALSFGADAIIDKVWQGVEMRFPGRGDPSALPLIGADRRIARGLTETDVGYATRLRRWLSTWRHAGSARGVLEAIAGYVVVAPKIQSILEGVDQSVWDVIDESADPTAAPTTTHVDPPNWTADALGYVKRRWLVIRDKNEATGEAWVTSTRVYGDGMEYGDNVAWGFNQSAVVFDGLREIVKTWKGAGTRYWDIIVNFDPDTDYYDVATPPGDSHVPNPAFGNSSQISIVGGFPVRVPSRYANSRYVRGVRE